MCGICGVVDLSGRAVDPALLDRMNETLHHRGPDSGGILVDGPVGLAARRLAIIDLAGGDQPIANEDGSVHVVQNGEIYNYRELRRELEAAGHRFRTASDTEVLVHLYEQHGDALAQRLRGMFAIAIWDARRRRLLLARDRYGIKPLYYSRRGDLLAFASELKALEQLPGAGGEIDPEALLAFLSFNVVPAPLSIYRDTRKLPAAHTLVVKPGRARVADPVPYARPAPSPAGELLDEDEETLARELRTRLGDSVRAHLIADVPVGVLLSGGLDSSGIAALAAQASSKPVLTFSIGFEERTFNELEQARLVARRYGTEHHELVVEPDAAELLPQLVSTFDEPFADSSALPTYLVSRLAAGHVKVALSGEGGDELFGGYNTYVADRLAPWIGSIARGMRPLIRALPASTRASSLDYRAKRFAGAAHLPSLERHHGWREIFDADARAGLLVDGYPGARQPLDLLRSRYAETAGAEELSRLMDVDMGPSLTDDLLVKTDRASMAHSLEVRVPMLDPVVTDFALALPASLKVRGTARKRLLRRALEPLLPPELLRGRKRGFSIPEAAWLRSDLQPLLRDVLSPASVRRHGIFEPAGVSALVDEHTSGRANHGHQLWGLLMLALWLDQHPRASLPARAAAEAA